MLAAYTFDDQIYTKYVEQLGAGSLTRRFDRAGNTIPKVPTHQLLARIGYDQLTGPLAGLGVYVEIVLQDDLHIDHANLLKVPDYAIVNLNLHYANGLTCGYAKRLNLVFEVHTIFDKTYIASAQNRSNSISDTAGLQERIGILADRTGSIFAGAPPRFVGGIMLSF